MKRSITGRKSSLYLQNIQEEVLTFLFEMFKVITGLNHRFSSLYEESIDRFRVTLWLYGRQPVKVSKTLNDRQSDIFTKIVKSKVPS